MLGCRALLLIILAKNRFSLDRPALNQPSFGPINCLSRFGDTRRFSENQNLGILAAGERVHPAERLKQFFHQEAGNADVKIKPFSVLSPYVHSAQKGGFLVNNQNLSVRSIKPT